MGYFSSVHEVFSNLTRDKNWTKALREASKNLLSDAKKQIMNILEIAIDEVQRLKKYPEKLKDLSTVKHSEERLFLRIESLIEYQDYKHRDTYVNMIVPLMEDLERIFNVYGKMCSQLLNELLEVEKENLVLKQALYSLSKEQVEDILTEFSFLNLSSSSSER